MSTETTATIEDLRAAGFTSEALAYPRDETALRLLCAFIGVDWQAAPPGWWFHPNETTKTAWQRVADEARAIFGESAMSTETTPEQRRKLDATAGSSWGFQDGMVHLQLWPERCADPFSIWMTPGQVLDLIESGARAARKAMKEQL